MAGTIRTVPAAQALDKDVVAEKGSDFIMRKWT